MTCVLRMLWRHPQGCLEVSAEPNKTNGVMVIIARDIAVSCPLLADSVSHSLRLPVSSLYLAFPSRAPVRHADTFRVPRMKGVKPSKIWPGVPFAAMDMMQCGLADG